MLAVFAVASLSLPAQVPACTPLQRAALEEDKATTQRLAGRRMLGIGPPKSELEVRSDEPGPCFRRTPLMLAAEHGSLVSARILISSGAAVDAVALLPELGDAALDARCLALVNGHAALVALLETSGAQTAACTDNALLFAALAAGSTDLVERQLRAHPSAQTLQAALLSAVGQRRGKSVDLIISALTQTPQPDLQPVFAAAVAAGDAEMIQRLGAGGVRIRGGAELAQAILANQVPVIEGLVAAGARTDNDEVRMALIAALRDRRAGTLLALVDTGYRGDPEVPILAEAIAWTPGVVPKLVKAGVAVEVDDERGTTPLMAAGAAGDASLVNLLLERGAASRTGNVECRTMNDLLHPSLVGSYPKVPSTPVLPGRAARTMGVTCGEATLNLTFPKTFEVFLASGTRPIASGVSYRLDPGTTHLRVKDVDTERKVTVKLRAGLNLFIESFAPNSPLTTLEAPPVDREPTKSLELHEVLKVVGAHKTDVAQCRKRHRVVGVVDEGPLVMTFRVSTEGAATGVAVVPTNTARAVYARCLQGTIAQWKFPSGRTTKEPFFIPFK